MKERKKERKNFNDNNNYNLRSGSHLSRPILHTTHYGTESITNLGAKTWELAPQNIKVACRVRVAYLKE